MNIALRRSWCRATVSEWVELERRGVFSPPEFLYAALGANQVTCHQPLLLTWTCKLQDIMHKNITKPVLFAVKAILFFCEPVT